MPPAILDDSPADAAPGTREHEWRVIILDHFRAQEEYLRAMKALGAGDASVMGAWRRLQAAELRRDDFVSESGSWRALAEGKRA
jgi:hypothetical protein